MLKKTIKYADLDGNPVEGDFYFHISKAELAKWALTNDNLERKLVEIVRANDGATIIRTFEEILEMTYGVRSEDGKRFIKSHDLWVEFQQCGAYDVFFMELVTNSNFAAEFIRDVVPPDLQEGIDDEMRKFDSGQVLELPVDTRPVWEKENREPTDAEILNMSHDQLVEYFEKAPNEDPPDDPTIPAWIREKREPTKAELRKMSKGELLEALKIKRALRNKP